jgi:hypothetical protein
VIRLLKILLITVFILPFEALAQIPEHIQVENDPPNWGDISTIIALIIIPAFLLGFSFFWRARLKAKSKEQIDS